LANNAAESVENLIQDTIDKIQGSSTISPSKKP
jgi:hypothetical protein